MSGISGPIPSHALYESNADFDEQRRDSRIRCAAAAAAAAAAASSSPPPSRSEGDTRDFVRENARWVREMARTAREAEAARESPVPRSQQKFHDVAPRVYSHMPDRYLPDSAPRPDFLRAHEKTGPDPLMGDSPLPPFPRTAPKHKLSIPKASSQTAVRPPQPPVNFIRANAMAAARPPSARTRRSSSSPRPPSAGEAGAPPDSYRRGQLPEYLMKRRQLWADAKAAEEAARPDPEQPSGHRRLDEAERLRTLALLQEGQSRLLGEVNRLPITADTLRARQRKGELESQLAELDQAVRVFSRPKVFVKMD